MCTKGLTEYANVPKYVHLSKSAHFLKGDVQCALFRSLEVGASFEGLRNGCTNQPTKPLHSIYYTIQTIQYTLHFTTLHTVNLHSKHIKQLHGEI